MSGNRDEQLVAEVKSTRVFLKTECRITIPSLFLQSFCRVCLLQARFCKSNHT